MPVATAAANPSLKSFLAPITRAPFRLVAPAHPPIYFPLCERSSFLVLARRDPLVAV